MTSPDSVSLSKADEKTPYQTTSLDHELGHSTTHVVVSNTDVLLSPTPTQDPLDPLNWTKVQKAVILAIVCVFYFLFTYQTTVPNPAFTLLQDQFQATYTEVNWTFAIPSLGLALGPLFTTALADIFGRRNVMIGGTMVALIASGCTSITNLGYSSYMAARFFQGFGASPAATVGLGIINDISFEHERGFYIGLWAMSIDLGGLVGGFIGGFLATIDQYWCAYVTTILYGALLLAELLFLPETLYPRALVLDAERQRIELGEKRTKQLGLYNVRKIPGVKHPKPWDTFLRFGTVWTYPVVVGSLFTYVFCQYWWICSFLTMIPAAYEDYSLQIQSLFYVGLILGTVFAEVTCSGRLSDWLMLRSVRRNNGERIPENRLWLGYPAAILSAFGLLIWGLSIDRDWHWITGQIAFFLYAAGLQIGNTVVSSYIVDCYPDHVMNIITYYTVIINLSAFIEPWFINTWVEASGYTLSFAAQAIVCAFGVIPSYFVIQKIGARFRPSLAGVKA